MDLLLELRERARRSSARVVLPEASDERVEWGKLQYEMLHAKRSEGESRRREAALRAKQEAEMNRRLLSASAEHAYEESAERSAERGAGKEGSPRWSAYR